MLNQVMKRGITRRKRCYRVRKRLKGTAERPRLSVFKSHKHIGGQLIDDEAGVTLAFLSTASKASAQEQKKSKVGARFIGAELAKLARDKKIERVIFDRGRFKFHGLVAELAHAARENGLKF